MLSQASDSFDDAELTLMAIQIKKDLDSKSNLDPSDEELTSLAMEIMRDLSTKPQLDSNDSYIFKLDGMDLFDHDIIDTEIDDNDHISVDDQQRLSIEEQIVFEPQTSHSNSDSSNISYTNNTNNTNTTNTTNPSFKQINTENTENNMVYVAYPSMSPQIVSVNRLISNDSFANESINIPPIPEPSATNTNKYKFPGNKKRAVNGWMQYQNQKKERKNNMDFVNENNNNYISPNNNYISPNISPNMNSNFYLNSPDSISIPPPLFMDKSTSDYTLSPQSKSKSISSGISRCISPRAKTPKQRISKIPDFVSANTIASPRSSPRTPPRSPPQKIPSKYAHNKRNRSKQMVEIHPAKRAMSPIFIDSNMNMIALHQPQERSTNFFAHECEKITASQTPTVQQSKGWKINNKKKRKERKSRAKSIAVSRQNNMENPHEYAVETADGFLFINPYKL